MSKCAISLSLSFDVVAQLEEFALQSNMTRTRAAEVLLRKALGIVEPEPAPKHYRVRIPASLWTALHNAASPGYSIDKAIEDIWPGACREMNQLITRHELEPGEGERKIREWIRDQSI